MAYATAVKSVPVVLSSARKHGFENYAHFQSVNSAEATQTLSKAEDILRYMAYGPLSNGATQVIYEGTLRASEIANETIMMMKKAMGLSGVWNRMRRKAEKRAKKQTKED